MAERHVKEQFNTKTPKCRGGKRLWLWRLTHQATVDRDSLSGPLSRGSSAFKPLRASQIYKVKLGHQRLILWLRNGTGVHTIHLLVTPSSSILQEKQEKTNQNTEKPVSVKLHHLPNKWQWFHHIAHV